MALQKGRDFLLKVGDGAVLEVFSTIGAARLTSLQLDNNVVEVTSTAGTGAAEYLVDAGVQMLELAVEGLFKDGAAEERLRDIAFTRQPCHCRLCFPDGAIYAATFVVQQYRRSGAYEGLEAFSARLLRSGEGTYTP